MISSSRFVNIFGLVPAGDDSHTVQVARAAAQAGFAVVLCRPGTKAPFCPLPARTAKRGHPCGIAHASTNPTEVQRWLKRYPDANIGIELGRSRMLVVDVDTPAELEAFLADWSRATGQDETHRTMTVKSPGARKGDDWVHSGGGHFWFTLPDGMELPRGLGVFKAPGGWVAMWAEHQVLVPPSRRPEGAYQLIGQAETAPAWLTDMAIQEVESRRLRAERNLESLTLDDPLERWSATTPWSELLADWTDTGLVDTCSCPIWTAPGMHASAKSATAHDVGCTRFDVSTGWAPLHVWTDNPPSFLAGVHRKTWTKLQYLAARDHDGNDRDAMLAIGVLQDIPVPEVMTLEYASTNFNTNDRSGTSNPLGVCAEFDSEESLETSESSVQTPGGMSTDEGRNDPFDCARIDPDGEDQSVPDAQIPTDQSDKQPAGRRMLVTRASQIRMRATRWLWQDSEAHWLPLGGLSLLGGREGIGKTTIAYGLAAEVTSGALPGAFEGQRRSVVIAATEDAWEQTVVPRLAACGADLDRIFRVDVVHENGLMTGLQLPRDVMGLQDLCREQDVALVLLDPLLAVISGKLDTHKDAEVRQALEPLSRLAHDAQVSVLGLIHVNKSTTADLLTRLMASRAFSAVARTVLFAARDDEIPEAGIGPEQGETFLFGQPKNNLAARVPHTLRYQIKGQRVGWDDELQQPIYGSRIEWSGRRDERIDDVLTRQESQPKARRETAQDRAVKWLEAYLSEQGVCESAQVKKDADEAGHALRTVMRAVSVLEVVIQPIPGTRGKTTWSLPTGIGITDTTDMTGTVGTGGTT